MYNVSRLCVTTATVFSNKNRLFKWDDFTSDQSFSKFILSPFILQRTLQRRDALYLLHLTRRCLRKFPRGGKSLISEEISLPLGGTGHGRTDLADERKTRKATQKRKKTFPSTKPEETHNSVTSSMSTFSVLTVAIGQYQCIMHYLY